MEIILFIFGSVGLTHIVVDSSLMLPIRELFDKYLPEKVAKLIHCYQCSGFWCGLFCCWAAFPGATWWQILVGGFAASVLANFMAIFMNYLEASTFINMPSEERK
jgi:hypothetical protein